MAILVFGHTTGSGAAPAAGTPLFLSFSGTYSGPSSSTFNYPAATWAATDSTSNETLPDTASWLVTYNSGAGFGTKPYGQIGVRVPGGSYSSSPETAYVDGGNWTAGSGDTLRPDSNTSPGDQFLFQYDRYAQTVSVWEGKTISGTQYDVDGIVTSEAATLHINLYQSDCTFEFVYGLYEWP